VTDPEFSRDIAMLGGRSVARIDAPDTVRVGQTFAVTLYSWGSGTITCNDPAGVEVTRIGNVVRGVIFARYPSGNVVCTSDLRSYQQPFATSFSAAGVGTIRSVGRSGSRSSALDSIEKTVVVVP
jgi:hypothetical protein